MPLSTTHRLDCVITPTHPYDHEMTPTPTTSQAEASPRLFTPEVRIDPSSPAQSVELDLLTHHRQMSPEGSFSSSTPFLTNMFQSNTPSTYAQSAPTSTKGKAPMRRQSRFDPMMREDESDLDEEGYGDLGQRHPLRRVNEEPRQLSRPNAPESVSLPGIKSLFGVAGTDHPPTPSSSSLFNSPSLPSLTPGSPSTSTSPSSARTSRYSSLASSAVPERSVGWWLPEFDGPSPQPLGVFNRSSSYPTQPYVADVHESKRRRSDGPPALRDAEESARLRWVAQNRNASYPNESPALHNYPTSTQSLRGMLHPPPASSAAMSAAMSRGSVSGSTAGGPLSPTVEHAPSSARRPSAASRSSSLVGGQLSRHFADLTTTSAPVSSASDMPPPLSTVPQADRRPSSFFPPITALDDGKLLAPPSAASSRPSSRSPDHDRLRRQSLTRPSSPEAADRPTLRRSSLTEIIMAKSGDDVAMAKGQYGPFTRVGSIAMEKPSFSEPVQPVISGWPGRGESADLVKSDSEGPVLSLRGRKRSADMGANAEGTDDGGIKGDPAMRGMEVLAESATRVAELEERNVRRGSEDDRESSPSRSATTSSQAGPKYTCAYCAKTFSRPSSLRIHTYSHTGERPYVCKEPSCRRRFSVQSNLKRHAKVHQMAAAGHGEGLPSHPHPGRPLGHPPLHHQLGMRGPPQHMHGPPTFHPPPAPYPYPHSSGPLYAQGPPPGPHGMPHPYPEHFDPGRFGVPSGSAPPPAPYGHAPGPNSSGHLFPPPPGYQSRSASSSRRTSRDDEWSEREGDEDEEDEEEIDELDEDA